jgi:hypothetical protein
MGAPCTLVAPIRLPDHQLPVSAYVAYTRLVYHDVCICKLNETNCTYIRENSQVALVRVATY